VGFRPQRGDRPIGYANVASAVEFDAEGTLLRAAGEAGDRNEALYVLSLAA
jgi:hypothetical protein